MKKELSMIVCTSINGVIGRAGSLPWHYPADLKRFQALTMGHVLIMGRKCYQCIGKPLKGRWTIVISRNPNFKISRGDVVNSLEAALALAYQKDSSPFICGGSQIFKQYMPKITRLFMTIINETIEGDSYFDIPNKEHWQLAKSHQSGQLTFLDLTR